MDKIPLATENSRIWELDEAAIEFKNGHMTKSAILFLKAYRALSCEYELQLYKKFDDVLPATLSAEPSYSWSKRAERDTKHSIFETPKGRETEPTSNLGRDTRHSILEILTAKGRESERISNLINFTLHDLALACFRNMDEYKNIERPNCTFGDSLYLPRSGWKGSITTEELEFDDRLWEKGSGVGHMFPLLDPLGSLLSQANSFKEVANIVAYYCFLRSYSYCNGSSERYRLVKSNMWWVMTLTSSNKAWVKAYGPMSLEQAGVESMESTHEAIEFIRSGQDTAELCSPWIKASILECPPKEDEL